MVSTHDLYRAQCPAAVNGSIIRSEAATTTTWLWL